MNKTIKIGFTGQSKAVVCSTSIEYSGDSEKIPDKEAVVRENVELFEIADKYAKVKTLEKVR